MGKKGYQGESPKDRATNIMDKFIQRSDRKAAQQETKPLIRKDPNIPMDLWPLKDQLEYWDNRTPKQLFQYKYTYSSWYDEVLDKSGMYPITFRDCVSKHQSRLQELFNECTSTIETVLTLQKEKIIF
tara:strand:+ start:27 stop:410 length:384 start_codon:yes stop_codon:yes gene_type:complete